MYNTFSVFTWDVVIADKENSVSALEYFRHALFQPDQFIGK